MSRDRTTDPGRDDEEAIEGREDGLLFSMSWFQDCLDAIAPTIEVEGSHMENLYLIALTHQIEMRQKRQG
jgi:hypothetical protein